MIKAIGVEYYCLPSSGKVETHVWINAWPEPKTDRFVTESGIGDVKVSVSSQSYTELIATINEGMRFYHGEGYFITVRVTLADSAILNIALPEGLDSQYINRVQVCMAKTKGGMANA